MATAAALSSASDGARRPRSGHPTLARHSEFADNMRQTTATSVCRWTSVCSGLPPQPGQFGLPRAHPWKEESNLKGTTQAAPAAAASASCQSPGRKTALVHHTPPATRLAWWVSGYRATRKGSSRLDELSGRTTNWIALKWPQHFSVL